MIKQMRKILRRVLPVFVLAIYLGTNVTTAFAADTNDLGGTVTQNGTLTANQKALLHGGDEYTNLSEDSTCTVDSSTDVSAGAPEASVASDAYTTAQVQTFAREPITSTWNISDSTAEQWFLKQDTAQAVISKYGLTSSNINQMITSAVKAANVSPPYFYLYAVNEGGGLGGFINHYSGDVAGGGAANATRDAQYIASQAQKTGDDPAWIDVDNYKDFVPAAIKASGDADFKSMPVGTIGRIYIPATAAAAWEVYYPAGLKASVNGVQDYGPPLLGTMQNIKRIGGDPLVGGVSVDASDSGSCPTTPGVAGAGMTKAINFALMIANNNGYGYDNSAARTSGWPKWQSDPNCTNQCGSFDCSSFVSAALTEAGYFTKSPDFDTGAEGDYLKQAGFTQVFTSDTHSFVTSDGLLPGDILVKPRPEGHTEIYIGNNKTIGAHSNYDGKLGDSTPTGKEISVVPYQNHPWESAWRATK